MIPETVFDFGKIAEQLPIVAVLVYGIERIRPVLTENTKVLGGVLEYLRKGVTQ